MAESREETSLASFPAEKEIDLVPVDPCKGWVNPCVFCDRSFGEWLEANEENITKIPAKPGILEIALRYTIVTKVLNIILDDQDIRKAVDENVNQAKKLIGEDKFYRYKFPKVLCRWVTLKQDNEKAVAILCAHWYNNGVLPDLLKTWPGLGVLQKIDSLAFSDVLQKWCYSKQKGLCSKPVQLEVVKACTLAAQCEICDTYLSQWKKLDRVIFNRKAPDAHGIYILAVSCERRIKVYKIVSSPFKIKYSIDIIYKSVQHILEENEYENKNAFLLIRWMECKDFKSDVACFLYAHWLNSEPLPLSYEKEIVERNRNFVFRTNDNKWCYEIDTFKQAKITKRKQKDHILNELTEDVVYLNRSSN